MLTISILSAAFYSRFLLQNSVDNTVDQLTGTLRKAQTYSMAGKGGSAWSVNYSSNTITLYKGSSFALRDPASDEKFSINPNVVISGLSDIFFARATGLPTPSYSGITVSADNNSKTITVNQYGMVTR